MTPGPPLPIEPMLARAVDRLPPSGALPGGVVFEPKWDGYRMLISTRGDRVRLWSRRGTPLGAAFPEITRAAAELGEEVVLDGEVVIFLEGRLDFGALQRRLGRRLGETARLARVEPAHFIAFDLLHRGQTSLLDRPYRARRAALEQLFAEYRLAAPWALSPSTSDRRQAQEWLTYWSAVGVEGVVCKGAGQRYEPGRGWLKVRSGRSTEAVLGAVTGRLEKPRTVLLGRYDGGGRLRLVARSAPLAAELGRGIGRLLAPRARGTRGPGCGSVSAGAAVSRWSSRWWSPRWWWSSPATRRWTAAGGGIRYACCVLGRISRLLTCPRSAPATRRPAAESRAAGL
jgi:ATP-dependent DNA ligase